MVTVKHCRQKCLNLNNKKTDIIRFTIQNVNTRHAPRASSLHLERDEGASVVGERARAGTDVLAGIPGPCAEAMRALSQ